jgi:hypothetical protein
MLRAGSRSIAHWTAALLVLAVLVGCAGYSGARLMPGASEADVRASMGAPQRVWSDAGGGSSWEYARGPEGKETYMARLGPDGRLVRIDQVLSEPFFAQLQSGMTTEAVARLLGRPYSSVRFPLSGETVWAWRFQQSDIYAMCFYAHFNDDGRLVRTSMGQEDAPDDWPRRRGC